MFGYDYAADAKVLVNAAKTIYRHNKKARNMAFEEKFIFSSYSTKFENLKTRSTGPKKNIWGIFTKT